MKFYLRAVANAILDYKMHCTSMTDDEALKFLIRRRISVRRRSAVENHPRKAKHPASFPHISWAGWPCIACANKSSASMGNNFNLGRYHEAVLASSFGAGEISARFGPRSFEQTTLNGLFTPLKITNMHMHSPNASVRIHRYHLSCLELTYIFKHAKSTL